MKLSNILTNLVASFSIGIFALGGVACQDENFEPPFDFSTTGRPASVSFSVSAPKMEVKSRADLSDANANRVESLWVRIYNANTGEATSESIMMDGLSTTTTHEPFNLDEINTKSGLSFIVAVANVDCPARKYNADGSYAEGTLREFLAEAETWTDFCSISVLTHTFNDNPSVTVPLENLPMCGIYYANSNISHDKNLDWSTLNDTPFFIPVTQDKKYTLPGYIHLRRLVSYVKFNLVPGNGVTLTPQSYRVVNAPSDSWLFDRSGAEGSRVPVAFNKANVAEMSVKSESDVSKGFFQPDIFTRASFQNGTSTGSYTFDFWQMENKHNGTAATYNDREKEYKVNDSGEVLPGSADSGMNSGIYTALCPDGKWSVNNTASMVEIRCNVSPAGLNTGGATASNNFGTAIITVHLGYAVGANASLRSQDFNCFRNSKYNYTVTINSLDNIRVEAETSALDDENIPGLEGSVTQISDGNYELDAHYGVFNISLSNNERLSDEFGFIVETWENGSQYSYDETSTIPSDKRKYLDWVELIPTSGPTVLAAYNPEKVIKLDQLGAKNANGQLVYPNYNNQAGQSATQSWYTVHINEYVYEASSNETGGAWRGYVNQPNRACWIKTRQDRSPDGQSVYITSKYAFSQKSIQTYYDLTDTDVSGAVGLEHVNETRGLNMRSKYPGSTVNGGNKMNGTNGRYNVYAYLTNSTGGNSQWGNVMNVAEMQTVPAITAQYASYPQHTATDNMLNVPSLVNTIATSGQGLSSSPYDPQPNLTVNQANRNKYMEAMNACTNRNRDNNGNGRIDADEVRWYVPATSKCLRMILGRNSLSTPVMNYNSIENKLYYPTSGNQSNHDGKNNNTRFKMFSSTREVVWAFEGLSLSQLGQSWTVGFWEVRCVRNLGTNLSATPTNTDNDGTTPAFSYDGANTISLDHYDSESIRQRYSTIPIHFINSEIIENGQLVQSDYNMCYSSFEFAPKEKDIHGGVANSNSTAVDWVKGNPCNALNRENNGAGYNNHNDWRVPNQKEMSIIRNAAPSSLTGGVYYLTCTQEYFDMEGYKPYGRYINTERRLLSVESLQTCAFNPNGKTMYMRCVRDK